MKFNKYKWDGLRGHWDFNDGRAQDKSGNGNNGTLNGAAVSSKGKIGQGMEFDGANSWINCGSDVTLDNVFANGGSWALWVKADSMGEGSQGLAMAKGVSPDAGRLQIGFANNAANDWHFFKSCDTAAVESNLNGNAVNLAEWTHIILTWDGSLTAANVHQYFNLVEGSYSAQNNGSTSVTSDDALSLTIGSRGNGTRTFDGIIDEVYVFSRVLNDQEKNVLFADGKNIIPKFKKVYADAL